MADFSWEEAINSCWQALAALTKAVPPASPPVSRMAKVRVAASWRRVEARPFTDPESTSHPDARNEYRK
jgi:hypothetical protein